MDMARATGVKDTRFLNPKSLRNKKLISEVDFWRAFAATAPKNTLCLMPYQEKGVWVTPLVFYIDFEYLTGGGYLVLSSSSEVRYHTWSRCNHTWLQSVVGKHRRRYHCDKRGCGAEFFLDS